MTLSRLTLPVTTEDIFAAIQQCIELPAGFYIRLPDGRTAKIDHLQEVQDGGTRYPLKQTVMAVGEGALSAAVTTTEIQEGLSVYYTRFDQDAGDFVGDQGSISSIKDKEGRKTFKITGNQVSSYLGSPVFICDANSGILNLIGVIVKSNKALHIDNCNSEYIHCVEEASDIERGDVRYETDPDKYGYFCECKELHMSNSQRGISIELKQHDDRGRKRETKKINYLIYQIFLDGEKLDLHNPAYKKNANDVYEAVAKKFHRDFITAHEKEKEKFKPAEYKPIKLEVEKKGYYYEAKLDEEFIKKFQKK